MGSDWGATGPNCTTFTFDTLTDALEQVIENTEDEKLRCEAEEVLDRVEDVEPAIPSPDAAVYNLDEVSQAEEQVVRVVPPEVEAAE
jgi:hypothetical protein